MNLSNQAFYSDLLFAPASPPPQAAVDGPGGVRRFAEIPHDAPAAPSMTASVPRAKALRAYLPAYLFAAGTLAFAAFLLFDRPAIGHTPAPPAASAAPPFEPQPPAPEPPPPKPPASTAAVKRPASIQPGRGAPAASPSAAPRLHLAHHPPEIDGDLLEAHARLEAHDFAGARQAYEQVLRRAPQDIGSLLALAAIASFQGQDEEATRLRRRAFDADPSNPAAQAALLDTAGADAEPMLAESRLKSLLARQAAPPLEFALGNLLARQRRWPEAQQAYFRALAGDADNPDYLFNLAVSLEHLRQPRIAATYYRQALAASAGRAAAFNQTQAEQRAGELAPAELP